MLGDSEFGMNTGRQAADAMVYATSFRSIKPLNPYYSNYLLYYAIVKDLTIDS